MCVRTCVCVCACVCRYVSVKGARGGNLKEAQVGEEIARAGVHCIQSKRKSFGHTYWPV